MNLSSLEATFEANKLPVLAAAGAGVVGLGLYAKKKKATTAGGGGAVTTAAGVSSGGQTAGMTGSAYDSSASDLYGAIQPQLESLGGQLTDLRNLYASSSTPPTPVPAATANPTPAGSSTSVGAAPPTPVYASDPGLPGQWVSGAANGGLSNGGAVFYPSPSLVTGSYANTSGQAVTTHYAQPLEQAVWSKGADGLLHNQWGNTTTRLDQYGTPVG